MARDLTTDTPASVDELLARMAPDTDAAGTDEPTDVPVGWDVVEGTDDTDEPDTDAPTDDTDEPDTDAPTDDTDEPDTDAPMTDATTGDLITRADATTSEMEHSALIMVLTDRADRGDTDAQTYVNTYREIVGADRVDYAELNARLAAPVPAPVPAVTAENVMALVTAALADEGFDPATGTVTDACMGPILVAFTKLSRRDVPKVTDAIMARMTENVLAGNVGNAQALARINGRLRDLSNAAKITVDPNAINRQRAIALLVAYRHLMSTLDHDARITVTATARDMAEPFGALVAHMSTDGATIPATTAPIVAEAWRVSRGIGATRQARATGTGTASAAPRAPRAAHTGANRSVGAHIVSALRTVSVGGMITLRDIEKVHRSEEYGPTEAPSGGAINAHLFDHATPRAERTLDGMRYVGDFNANGSRVARRVS